MQRTNDKGRTDLISATVKVAKTHLSGSRGERAEAFLRHYYAKVPVEDIAAEDPVTLFRAALAHWKFGEERPLREAKVRAYNPKLEEDGWQCDHTVIEVVTDDMPFLVDSVAAELQCQDVSIHTLVHPVFDVKRDGGRRIQDITAQGKGEEVYGPESFMHLRVSAQAPGRLKDIERRLEAVLTDVRAVVADWSEVRSRLASVVDEVRALPKGVGGEDLDEVEAFLRWVYDNNFTLLGYRSYVVGGSGERITSTMDADSGRGLLRDSGFVVFRELRNLKQSTPEVRAFVASPTPLTVTKSDTRSTVRRSVHLDAILVKRFGKGGAVTGMHVFVGLFSSSAYNGNPFGIPLLRRKIARVIERAGFPENTHDSNALRNILETFPRDELFQVTEEHLFRTSLGVLALQERPRVAVFMRRDDMDRFMSCLVYVPRDRFSTDLRLRVHDILMRAFNGETTAYYIHVSESPLARLHTFIRTTPRDLPPYDPAEIERAIVEAARSWADRLLDALVAERGEEEGLTLYRRYGEAFPSNYREHFAADAALADVAKLEAALATGILGMSLYRPIEAADHQMRFKVYHPDSQIPLSHVLPMLEHMGLIVHNEIPYNVRPDGRLVMIHDFGLETKDGSAIDLGAVRQNFQDAFIRIWRGEVESDGFNVLVLKAGLTWRQVVILRAACKYLRQAGIAFSQAYMENTLAANPGLAALIVELFEARFDPARQKGAKARTAELRSRLAEGLETVASADDDRILRRFINLIEASLRTNYYQPGEGGQPKPYLSIKIDSRAVDELPLPRPLLEVFVYSPRTECIHLRGGKVARGGIRWSDRREDFRTEILGLMKAQVVKNVVIVPTGAKGGFVLKRPMPGADREALVAEAIECYKTLVCGLLDVTDNLKAGAVVPPTDVVRHDGDDPYMVVAADKGTATFSDIANALSLERGFWLGDAFASGGSQGYDHKEMGITSRGAWEAVKRHFRELGVDIQSQDFNVVGVGDMSGDVFGNAMLLSQHIRLLAAFDHRHIFLDPDPDPAISFEERQRLFHLKRSSWADYDRAKLSKGGAILERQAKSVAVSPEVRARFGIEAERLTPSELIRILLKAQVDLMWFGGIGTYVKATAETHAEVGDRANDALRINAGELRCKVVGEGANLALTQRGRVEYALAGGRLNTDAIDNSAGVDTSDHEVNIKILLDALAGAGDLTAKQRNKLLASMTDEVAHLVLRDNYLQTQAISLIQAQGLALIDHQQRLMRMLERQGRLDRAVEFLPDDEAIAERVQGGAGLTRPEIATLMSYAKIWLKDTLVNSGLPDDPRLANDLVRYFPSPLREKYQEGIHAHSLRREIIAMAVANSMINRVGGTFVTRVMETTGASAIDIASAYTIVRKIFRLRELWEEIEKLDNAVPAELQIEMLVEINRLVERGVHWFLNYGERPLDIGACASEYGPGVQQIAHHLTEVLPDSYREDLLARAAPYEAQGVPKAVACQVAGLINMASACDIVRLAGRRGLEASAVARLYFSVGAHFRLGHLRNCAERLPAASHWDKLAVASLIEEFYAHQAAITSEIVAKGNGAPDQAIPAWIESKRTAVERTEQLLSELWANEGTDLSMIAVASRQLRSLAETAGG